MFNAAIIFNEVVFIIEIGRTIFHGVVLNIEIGRTIFKGVAFIIEIERTIFNGGVFIIERERTIFNGLPDSMFECLKRHLLRRKFYLNKRELTLVNI